MYPYRRRRKRSKRGSRRDWSQLLPEILDLILQKLNIFRDYFVFGQVCTSWRSVFLDRSLLTRPPPCMLVTAPNCTTTALPLFVFQGDKLCKLRLRAEFLQLPTIVGSSMGWLVVGCINRPGLYLTNPLSDKRIPLPQSTTSRVPLVSGWLWGSCFQVEQIVLSSAPTSGDCILAARGMYAARCLQGSELYRGFLWCRLGDQKWRMFSLPVEFDLARVADLIFYDGKLHVLGNRGQIFVYTFDRYPKMISKGYVISNDSHHFRDWTLVDSVGEKLILVGCDLNPQYVTDYLFRQGEDGLWARVELADRVLLKGNHGVICLYSKDLTGLGFTAGCIYYGSRQKGATLLSWSGKLLRCIPIPHDSYDEIDLIQEIEWIRPEEW